VTTTSASATARRGSANARAAPTPGTAAAAAASAAARSGRRDRHRVVHGYDEGVRREPAGVHHLADRTKRDTGDDNVRVRHGPARVRERAHGADARDGRSGGDERRRALGQPVVHRELDARKQVPEHGDVGVSLDPGPDHRRARCPAHDGWRPAADGDPGHGGGAVGRDRPPVHDRQRDARHGVVDDHEAMERGQPGQAVRREAGDPLHAHEIRRTVHGLAPEMGRHGVDEALRRPRMHADLRGQLGAGREADQRSLGQPDPLGERRHARDDIRSGEVPEG